MEDCEKIVREATDGLGGLDIIISNAVSLLSFAIGQACPRRDTYIPRAGMDKTRRDLWGSALSERAGMGSGNIGHPNSCHRSLTEGEELGGQLQSQSASSSESITDIQCQSRRRCLSCNFFYCRCVGRRKYDGIFGDQICW